MPTRKCLGTKKNTLQSKIVILGLSINVRKYRQKIQNCPPPANAITHSVMSPIKALFPSGFHNGVCFFQLLFPPLSRQEVVCHTCMPQTSKHMYVHVFTCVCLFVAVGYS